MAETTFFLAFNNLCWALTVAGLTAVVLLVMLAVPLKRIPPLEPISRTARTIKYSDLPTVDRFLARDGTTLGFRHYPAHQPSAPRVAVLVRGSSTASIVVHALAAAGVETFAPDIRGRAAAEATRNWLIAHAHSISGISRSVFIDMEWIKAADLPMASVAHELTITTSSSLPWRKERKVLDLLPPQLGKVLHAWHNAPADVL
jgi:hypothetical protein